MPVFPRVEAEILKLARKVSNGMKAETEEISGLAASDEEIDELVERFDAKTAQINQREAELEMLYREKKALLSQIAYAVKGNLKMFERFFKNNGAKLSRYGWDARKRKTPASLPGQPRVLEAMTQGADWFDIDWKPPIDGGKVKFYIVRRLIEGETEWRQVGVFFKTEARLKNQPRKVDMQFLVVAVNKAGEGLPSNMINVVL